MKGVSLIPIPQICLPNVPTTTYYSPLMFHKYGVTCVLASIYELLVMGNSLRLGNGIERI